MIDQGTNLLCIRFQLEFLLYFGDMLLDCMKLSLGHLLTRAMLNLFVQPFEDLADVFDVFVPDFLVQGVLYGFFIAFGMQGGQINVLVDLQLIKRF